jgi:hypothetical protein
MSEPTGRLHGVQTVNQIAGERFARHGLADRPCGTPVAAAALTTALQAQDNLAGRLGIRARAPDVTDADVLHAHDVERSIVRTWLMRGTIHLVAASDLRWLVGLIGPSIVRKYRTRWRQLGLTDAVLDRCVEVLPELLAAGPLTRREIRAGLEERGVTLDSPDPQAPTHAVVYASAVGLLCRGPERGRESTFVLLDEWLPKAPAGPTGDDALAELARRYFAAYSPATAADFTTWSGLGARRAIELIRDQLTETDLGGRVAYRLGEAAPAKGVRLAPAFDNYVLGHRDRSATIDAEFARRVYVGGMIYPVVLRDGRAIGIWQLDRSRDEVRVSPFEPWSGTVQRAVIAEVADIGRFLGKELTLSG